MDKMTRGEGRQQIKGLLYHAQFFLYQGAGKPKGEKAENSHK